MKLLRTGCLIRGLAIVLLAALAVNAGAQSASSYPNRQITIIVGFTAGGTTDVIARIVAEEMRKTWGQPVVVDNKPGAGGNIGAAIVAKAKPDGYTLLMGSVGPLAINATLFEKMPYDNLKDFTPVSQVVHVPNMLVVNPTAMPVKNFTEFIALIKANPGKYFYASTGVGTSSHLAGVLLASIAGLEITHVPYKGSVALTDLLAGDQVHFMFATIPSVIQLVRSGKLHPLAVTSLERSASAPEIPAISELGYPGFEASSWFGMVGPADMPRAIALKIQAEIARILKNPEIREKLIQQGADPVGSTPDEFAAYMRAETAKWGKVIKASGAKAE
jgi:tripartite-type tricarboxylate transporter receptor subunit TctC